MFPVHTHKTHRAIEPVHFTIIRLRYACQVNERSVALTVEGQIAKCGSEEIHGEHAKDGYIANILHSSLGWALGEQDSRL